MPLKSFTMRERCVTCGRRLKISEINMCSCGTPVCSRHRYHTDHECTRVFEHKVEASLKKKKIAKI